MSSTPTVPAATPPGQRPGHTFPRFGAVFSPLPERDLLESPVQLTVTGFIEHKITIGRSDLESLPRLTQTSDLHCVTTWTKPQLEWSGWRFRDLYESVVLPRCQPADEVRFVVFFGLDGYRCSLPIEDALSDELLIADTLDGEPLSPLHGAPLRVVCPTRYAYKNLKHLSGLALRREAPAGLRLGLEHPTGRVQRQERHAKLPSWLVRLPYRALIGPTSWLHRRQLTSRDFVGSPPLIDQLMPSMDVNEVHDTYIEAPPSLVYDQLLATTGREIHLLRPLMGLRGLPARLLGRKSSKIDDGPVLALLKQTGFTELDATPNREIVLGTIGRFWKLTDNQPIQLRDRSEYLAFEEPGYAKAVMNFLVRSEGSGCRLVTETRISGTDARATRRFRPYWWIIRLGSGAIRRSWLAAIRRRVQRLASTEA